MGWSYSDGVAYGMLAADLDSAKSAAASAHATAERERAAANEWQRKYNTMANQYRNCLGELERKGLKIKEMEESILELQEELAESNERVESVKHILSVVNGMLAEAKGELSIRNNQVRELSIELRNLDKL